MLINSDKFNSYIKKNPPYRWFTHDKFFVYYGKSNYIYFYSLLCKQILTWIIKLFNINTLLLILKKDSFTIKYKIYSLLINCFTYYELLLWDQVGINSIKKISKYCPYIISKDFHDNRRRNDSRLISVYKFIGDKKRFLEIIPINIRPEFLTVNEQKEYRNRKDNVIFSKIFKEGLVLKPRFGNNSRNILHFQIKNKYLIYRPIFNNLPSGRLLLDNINTDVERIYQLWMEISGRNEEIIIMPYLNHTNYLPKTAEAIVFRVITSYDKESLSIKILHSWFEIPLNRNLVVFLNLHGNFILNKPSFELGKNYIDLIKQLTLTIEQKCSSIVEDSLNLVIKLHNKFKDVDKISWDIIPTDEGPALLEANTHYSILLPQIFESLSNKS